MIVGLLDEICVEHRRTDCDADVGHQIVGYEPFVEEALGPRGNSHWGECPAAVQSDVVKGTELLSH